MNTKLTAGGKNQGITYRCSLGATGSIVESVRHPWEISFVCRDTGVHYRVAEDDDDVGRLEWKSRSLHWCSGVWQRFHDRACKGGLIPSDQRPLGPSELGEDELATFNVGTCCFGVDIVCNSFENATYQDVIDKGLKIIKVCTRSFPR
jgi:hypothetical protein